MAWLGFATLLAIYWCIFLSASSGRLGWWMICVWLVPIFSMTIAFQEGMEINGLMVLICFLVFFLCRRGLLEVRMWNTKQRKKHSILFCFIYILLFSMFVYCYAEAQLQGYMLNIQGWGSTKPNFWPLFLTLMPMMVLNWYFTKMVYTTIDRLYCKPKELILLACNFYISSGNGGEKGFQKGYFLEGVQNGITYYFRMTRRTYRMLKKEPHLRLNVDVGLLGGQYITNLGNPDYLKRTRKSDRQEAKLAMFFFLVVAIGGIWLYWFR